MNYILDGYNIIHALPELERGLNHSLREARKRLVGLCESAREKRRDLEWICIVFDGSSEVAPLAGEGRPGVEVVFTESGEDADDRIIAILGRMGGKACTVVSGDNYVFNNARAYGARVISAPEFYALLREKTKAAKRTAVSEKSISEEEARALTDEYRRYLGIKK